MGARSGPNLSLGSRKLNDRMQRYDMKVAATMELAGRILWQRLAHVARRGEGNGVVPMRMIFVSISAMC